MVKVVIVPGFAESSSHFKKLIDLLKLHNYEVEVIMPWQSNILESYRNKVVFVGHSLGAYYLANQKLVPSLLIGLPDPILVRKYFGKSFLIVSNDSFKNKLLTQHSTFRLANAISLCRNFIPFLRFACKFYKNKEILETKNDSVILLQNELDPMIKKVKHGIHHRGHHDDILYNSSQYVGYIKTLSDKLK